MEYLKCNSCGHLNTLKTKYQIFCTDCNKKLENNFSDWNRVHPDKNFEDYKKTECISEEDINNAKASKNSKAKKKGLKYWIRFAATIAAISIATHFIDFSVASIFSDSTFNKVMMSAASQINESCPIMIDSETQLDNAIALPDNVFQYNYTLINYLKQDIDIAVAKSEIEPGIVNFVKTSPEMKLQREYKSTIKYAYKDQKGEYLFTIAVTPSMYEEK